jgi:hypothetical protein
MFRCFVGHRTNLLIYGPGGYKTTDFLAIGTPLQIVLWITSIALLSTTTTTNWWISWIVSFFALVLVVAMQTFDPSSFLSRSNK